MSEPKQRPKITVIDPDAGDDQAVLRAGNITIDLRKVQTPINYRKRDELSWSHLMKAIDGGTTVHGQHTGPGALQRVLRRQLVERLGRALTPSELSKLNDSDYPGPVEGFAATISEHFNLAEVAPQFNNVLLETEQKSLEKGQEIQSVDKNADRDGLAHDAAVLAAREADELERGAPAHTVVVDNEHTYVRNATEPHKRAHSAAREVRPGTDAWAKDRRGQFDSILDLVADARASDDWRKRAAAEKKPFSDPSYDR